MRKEKARLAKIEGCKCCSRRCRFNSYGVATIEQAQMSKGIVYGCNDLRKLTDLLRR